MNPDGLKNHFVQSQQYMKRKLKTNVHMNTDSKLVNKILANRIQQRGVYIMTKWDLFLECKGWFNMEKSINVINYISRMKGKNMVISI